MNPPFPTGRLISPRWRPVAYLAAFVCMLQSVAVAFEPGPVDASLPHVQNPLGIRGATGVFSLLDQVGPILVFLVVLACVGSLVLRFRRARGEERQQIKWFAYAVVLLTMLVLLSFLNYIIRGGDSAGPLWGIAFAFGIVCIPAAAGVAILRYRLYDIDILINRTLVYGALSACVIGIYVLVVGYLGALFRTDDNLLVSLIATGIVAVLFAPLRDHLQRDINRLMYGERDEPYAVLSRLGQRLEATLAPNAALDTIVETVAQALKLPYAAISLEGDEENTPASRHGTPTEGSIVLPLVYQTEPVGRLILSPRARGEEFSLSDRRLLEDLARQIGVAVHAVRLTSDLQRSRERLVSTREEERRRLRRDLHDGLGPQLAAQTLKVGSARSLYQRDPAARRCATGRPGSGHGGRSGRHPPSGLQPASARARRAGTGWSDPRDRRELRYERATHLG